MYQPTLGRFLSRDPLSENGVDVLTDTGFHSDRLAAMSANPRHYGGNWDNPYVYAKNNPLRYVDPSGLVATIIPTTPAWIKICENECAAKGMVTAGPVTTRYDYDCYFFVFTTLIKILSATVGPAPKESGQVHTTAASVPFGGKGSGM